MIVFTVGHSNHSLEAFLTLLASQQITAIADVRSMPYSRYVPHFNREAIRDSLKRAGIAYVDLSRELGARPDDSDCYVDDRVRFELYAKTAIFQSGLKRVMDGSEKFRIALMCAEKDPLDCHRGILIAPQLERLNVTVEHLRETGLIESHHDAMSRLMQRLGITSNDLFRSRDELIEEAYTRREEQIAYQQE